MNLIAKPFGYLLMFLYDFLGNYGLAIVFFAIIIKVVLLPFQMKSKRGMMQSARLSPLIEEIRKKHGANKAKYNEEVAKLYKEENVNPATGCIWSFITLPIMIALFYAIRQPITLMMGVPEALLQEGGALITRLNEMGFVSTVGEYYSEIAQSQFITAHFDKFSNISEHLRSIDYSFIGVDLSAQPQWDFLWKTDWSNADIWAPALLLFILPILSGGAQFLATLVSQKMNPPASTENQMGSMKMMTYMMPLFSVYIAFITPAALGFYWTLSALLQMGQDFWLTKRYRKIIDAEEVERNALRKNRAEELEAKRLETERKKAEGIAERNPNVSKRKSKTQDKQEQLEKSTQWNKKSSPQKEETEPSRVGNRRYARGRNYAPDRYGPQSEDFDSQDETIPQDELDRQDEINQAIETEASTETAHSDDAPESTEIIEAAKDLESGENSAE